MELDLNESGMKSNHLEVEEQERGKVGKKSTVGVGVVEVEGLKPEGVSTAVDMAMKMEDLEGLIKSLSLEDDDDDPIIIKAELISKLEVARVQSANEKKLARKTVWMEEARKEVLAVEEFGRRSMYDVFPELVWRRLLEHLPDRKDKALMSNISLLLRDLLKDEKTAFLFHSVFPLLDRYLPRNSLLNLRKICREWKGSVDSYWQNRLDYPLKHFLEGMKRVGTSSDSPTQIYRFQGHIDELAEFIEGYGPDWENPFITRKIALGFQLTYPDPVVKEMLKATYWNRVDNLLGIWGAQIWMAIILIDMDPNPAVLYQQVWNLLIRMPNLRFLELDGGVDYYKPPGRTAKDFNKVMEGLGRMMMVHPLPDLPFLKTLNCKEIPPPIVTGIVNKCSATLETLSIVEMIGEPNNASINNSSLPNLKVLGHLANNNIFMTGPIFQVDWPSLQETSLQYFNMEADDVPRIFHRLNQFRATMKKLTLHLHNHEGPVGKLSDRTLKELSLELPHLEELTFSVCRINLKTMDFILPMTSLKKLTVHYKKRVKNWILEKKQKPGPSKSLSKDVAEDASSSGEIIKFGSYMSRLYESNIWKLLPELNQVTIAVVTVTLKKVGSDNEDVDKKETKRKDYTREGYKHYCKSTVSVTVVPTSVPLPSMP